MRVRHKIPSLFSLSMVDVLCCALGCIIFLWLYGVKKNTEDVEDHKRETSDLVAGAKADREKSQAIIRTAKAEQDKLRGRIQALLSDLESAAALRARLDDQIRSLTRTRSGLETRLSEERTRARDLEAKLKKSTERVAVLEKDVLAGVARLDEERKRATGLGDKLSDSAARLKEMRAELDKARKRYESEESRSDTLRKTIDEKKRDLASVNRSLEEARAAKEKLEKSLSQRDKELLAARVYKDRWEAAEERERYLAKQLTDRQKAMAAAKRTLTRLEKEKRSLEVAAENRFAGITLTGKRVIFLVDMSGSMELVDETTPAPEKWSEVRHTVARLMRSLPELEKFQVITFSSKTDFPLGSPGEWLDLGTTNSPTKVLRVLGAIKPKGGTNMYAALESAFRFRADGLDTIYLLSDGLPNLGEGLTAAQKRDLSELDRGVILGKHVRKTLNTNWNKTHATRPKVRINTIGFFYESPDLGSFLWALARENEGSFVGMSKP
jgi:hypothetical protein